MVVDAEVKERQIRPLFGVKEEVLFKKDLTGPTLLEMSGYPTYQELRRRGQFVASMAGAA